MFLVQVFLDYKKIYQWIDVIKMVFLRVLKKNVETYQSLQGDLKAWKYLGERDHTELDYYLVF